MHELNNLSRQQILLQIKPTQRCGNVKFTLETLLSFWLTDRILLGFCGGRWGFFLDFVADFKLAKKNQEHKRLNLLTSNIFLPKNILDMMSRKKVTLLLCFCFQWDITVMTLIEWFVPGKYTSPLIFYTTISEPVPNLWLKKKNMHKAWHWTNGRPFKKSLNKWNELYKGWKK